MSCNRLLGSLITFTVLSLISLNGDASVLTPSPDLYLDKMIIDNGFYYFPVVGGNNFTITWWYPNISLSETGMLLQNFRTTTMMMSYIAQIVSQNQTQGIINLNAVGPGSGCLYLSFMILRITTSNDYMEIINYLSVGANNTAISFSSSKFVFSSTNIRVKAYLQWISLSLHSSSLEKFTFYISTVTDTSVFTLNIAASESSKITNVKVSIIIMCPEAHQPNIVRFQTLFSWHYVNTATNLRVPISNYGTPFVDGLCFAGFSYLWFDSTSNSFKYMMSNVTITGTSTNLWDYDFYLVCFALCPSGSIIFANPNSCTTCQSIIPNCLECLSSTICTKCMTDYKASNTTGKCFVCRNSMQYCKNCINQMTCTECYNGFVVTGGCATALGCIEVSQKVTYFGPNSTCIRCDTDSYLDPFYFICNCKTGFRAGLYCTTVVGCIITIIVGAKVQCQACSIYQRFYFDNSTKTCFCQSGFDLKGDQCQDICGDGRDFTLPCDDGNLIDGDGCSSQCTVEKKYKCNAVNTSTPSICKYIGGDIQISLKETQRSEDAENRGIFTFAVSPAIPALSKMDLSNHFNFSCENSVFQIVSWVYSVGQVVLEVDFQTDLEQRGASANFSFDKAYIVFRPIILNFTIVSNGEALIISQPSTQNNLLKYTLFGTSLLAGILLIVGSLFHRMAGVEMVNVLQTIYYLHYTINPYTPTVKHFQYMSAIGGNNLFIKKSRQNFQITEAFMRISFSMSQAEITVMAFAIIITVAGALVFTFFILSQLTKQARFFKFMKFFQSNVLLPLALALLLPSFLVDFSFSSHSLPDSVLFSEFFRSLLILITVMLISFASFKGSFQWLMKKKIYDYEKPEKVKTFYFSVFQLYLFLELVLMWLWLKSGIQICSYALLVLCGMMWVWQLFAKPYHYFLDSLSIFCNMLLVILFQIYLYLKGSQMVPSSESFQLYLYLALSGFICVCEVISVIRVIRIIIRKIKDKTIGQESENQRNKVKNVNQNKYQLFKESLPKYDKHFLNYMEGQVIHQDLLNSKNKCQFEQQSQELRVLKAKLIGKLRRQKSKKLDKNQSKFAINPKLAKRYQKN